MATKVKTGVIDSSAITSALIANASITADDLHATLDLTGKTVTVATATAGDNDTSVASTSFVSTAIANLADSAPSTLNTLNELAAALGDDANYATTTTNAIAAKLPLAGGTLTGNLVTPGVLIGTTDAGYPSYGDELTIGAASGNNGMTIRSGTSNYGTFYFSDATGNGAGTYAGKLQYNHANNSMVLATNSADRLTIDSGGSLGIGTTTPGSYDARANNLVVGDTGNAGMTIFTGASSIARLAFAKSGDTGLDEGMIDYRMADNQMRIATGGSDRLTIDSSGNVGIGITPSSASGTTRLQIHHANNTAVLQLTNGGGGGTGADDGGQVRFDDNESMYVVNKEAGILVLSTSNTDRLTILADGKVGIGTGAPGSQLHIKGTGHQRIKVEKTDAGGDADISIANRSDGTGWVLFTDAQAGANSGVIKYVHNGDYMSFRTNGVDDRMRIGSDGAITHSMTAQNTTSINTTNSDGPITLFKNNGTTRGMIGNAEGTMNGGTGNFGIRATADLIFSTGGGNKRWKVSSSGHFTPNNQHSYDIGGTNAEVRNIYAQGISFASNAHAAGKTSELLDDYEEGTWTPVLQNTGGQQPTHGTQSGKYTKVGDMVHVHGTITTTAGANMSGTVIISGLPFASNSGGNLRNVGSMGALGGCGAGAENCRLVLDPNNSYIFIIKQNGNAYSHNPGFGAAINMYGFSIVYSAA